MTSGLSFDMLTLEDKVQNWQVANSAICSCSFNCPFCLLDSFAFDLICPLPFSANRLSVISDPNKVDVWSNHHSRKYSFENHVSFGFHSRCLMRICDIHHRATTSVLSWVDFLREILCHNLLNTMEEITICAKSNASIKWVSTKVSFHMNISTHLFPPLNYFPH